MAREYDIQKTDNTYESVWEPGNGTRYELFLAHKGEGRLVLVWLNAPGHARAMQLFSSTDWTYMAEKFDYKNLPDLCPIMRWTETASAALGHPVECYLPPEFNTPAGIHKSRYSTLEQLAFIDEAS